MHVGEVIQAAPSHYKERSLLAGEGTDSAFQHTCTSSAVRLCTRSCKNNAAEGTKRRRTGLLLDPGHRCMTRR